MYLYTVPVPIVWRRRGEQQRAVICRPVAAGHGTPDGLSDEHENEYEIEY